MKDFTSIFILRYKKWLCLIFLYFYVYSPAFVFLPFGSSRIIVIWAIFFITIKRKWVALFSFSKSEILITIAIVIYTLIWYLFGGNSSLLTAYVFNIVQLFATSYLLVLYFGKRNISIYTLIHLAGIAGIISTILYFSPSAYQFLKSITRGEVGLIVGDLSSLYRGYGLATDKNFTFSVIQGLGVVLALHSSLVLKKYKFLIYVPFILLSIIFNARIGLVPIVIYAVIFIFNYASIKRVIGILLLFGFIMFLAFNFGSKKLLLNIQWAEIFFKASYNFITGSSGDIGHFSVLFGNFIFFPETLSEIIFGTGIDVFANVRVHHSDVGYIIQIYYGGIIFLLMLLIFNFIIFLKFQKYSPKDFSFMGWLFLLVTLICNIKGYFWAFNIAMTYIYLIVVIFYHQNFLSDISDEAE